MANGPKSRTRSRLAVEDTRRGTPPKELARGDALRRWRSPPASPSPDGPCGRRTRRPAHSTGLPRDNGRSGCRTRLAADFTRSAAFAKAQQSRTAPPPRGKARSDTPRWRWAMSNILSLCMAAIRLTTVCADKKPLEAISIPSRILRSTVVGYWNVIPPRMPRRASLTLAGARSGQHCYYRFDHKTQGRSRSKTCVSLWETLWTLLHGNGSLAHLF